MVFRHPQYGERRQTVEVGAAAPVDVTVSFGATAAAEAIPLHRNARTRTGGPGPGWRAAPPRLAPLSAPRAPRSDAIR